MGRFMRKKYPGNYLKLLFNARFNAFAIIFKVINTKYLQFYIYFNQFSFTVFVNCVLNSDTFSGLVLFVICLFVYSSDNITNVLAFYSCLTVAIESIGCCMEADSMIVVVVVEVDDCFWQVYVLPCFNTPIF